MTEIRSPLHLHVKGPLRVIEECCTREHYYCARLIRYLLSLYIHQQQATVGVGLAAVEPGRRLSSVSLNYATTTETTAAASAASATAALIVVAVDLCADHKSGRVGGVGRTVQVAGGKRKECSCVAYIYRLSPDALQASGSLFYKIVISGEPPCTNNQAFLRFQETR